ncbi:hypothetical protein QA601_00635 [Chitinispirillales bacterium ANBcel5]|uniref:hypothetical protein n=1 Tax=Cellulosispirillum alkaliphilum TaxID=3039283 RepID=UPI002A562669|nr:hypothetical protein [Chitinispirillales bacterium ANBcel5]
MKILLLENTRKRSEQIMEQLKDKNVEVRSCVTSNDFLETISETSFDKIVLNVEFWEKGRSMYSYFNACEKFEETPVVFYNADEEFVTICNRPKNIRDQVIHKPVNIEELVNAVMQV